MDKHLVTLALGKLLSSVYEELFLIPPRVGSGLSRLLAQSQLREATQGLTVLHFSRN